MKATIVIPNINGKGWLKDSIESVYAQTEQDFELIVVDNGSTDESLEQARGYCTRPNFTLIENGYNTGFSHAVNQGIARARSEFVVLFNNDAFAEPRWLAELIRTAESDPKIFAVQSLMIRHFDRELADDAGDYVTWMGFACKTGDGRRASRYTRQRRIFSACGGAALYRKSILDEIGGFDENFFAYFEDVDLSWRANNAGYKNVLCPTARCYHICGASTGAVKYNAFKSQQSGRNSILLRRVVETLAAHAGVGRWAEAKVIPAVPVDEVVLPLIARAGKVGNFVLLVAVVFQLLHGVEVKISGLVGSGQALRRLAAKGGVRLDL